MSYAVAGCLLRTLPESALVALFVVDSKPGWLPLLSGVFVIWGLFYRQWKVDHV